MVRPQPVKIALFFSAYHKYPPAKSAICAPLFLVAEICAKIDKKIFRPTLIAPKGSRLKAAKIYTANIKPLFGTEHGKGQNIINSRKIIKKFSDEEKFDLINCHHPQFLLPVLKKINAPVLFTFHDPIDRNLAKIIKKSDVPNYYYQCLTKKHAIKFPIKKNKKVFIINNGLDLKNYPFKKTPRNHLVFAGRLIPEKGADVAIRVAKNLGLELKIAGPVLDDKYWQAQLKDQFCDKIRYVKMTPFKEVPSLYQNAKALLFPIRWEEPFGLVMIESMACGTPVIAFNRGAVPEIIKNGVTGFIVKNEREMVVAVKKIYAMPEGDYQQMRLACRRHIEKNFPIEKMIKNYENAYNKIIKDFKCFKKLKANKGKNNR